MQAPTRLWICTNHDTFYPASAASVIMANSETEARELLRRALRKKGLIPADFTLIELDISLPFARVIYDPEAEMQSAAEPDPVDE